MKFEIKKATAEDASAIAPLFDAYRVFYQKESDLALAQEFITARLENGESTIFTAVDDTDKTVGFMQLYPTFSSVSAKCSWVLNDLYVLPSFRGSGIAKMLMEKARQLAVATGANGIALETAPDNTSARALYESLGYELDSTYLHYFLSV